MIRPLYNIKQTLAQMKNIESLLYQPNFHVSGILSIMIILLYSKKQTDPDDKQSIAAVSAILWSPWDIVDYSQAIV